MPVSISPTRAPLPRFTAYEPADVAPIARMSHWHALSGSGPIDGRHAVERGTRRVLRTPAVFVPGGGAARTVAAMTSAAIVAARVERNATLGTLAPLFCGWAGSARDAARGVAGLRTGVSFRAGRCRESSVGMRDVGASGLAASAPILTLPHPPRPIRTVRLWCGEAPARIRRSGRSRRYRPARPPTAAGGSTGRAAKTGSRPSRTASDAATKPSNSGCGRSGRDLNSGWNWLATNHGWSRSSTISTSRPSGDWPDSTMPAASSVWR